LDAAVGLGLVADELDGDLQLEVLERLGGAEELVVRHDRVERPADDGPVLDLPRLLGVPLPPSQRLAVEERNGLVRREDWGGEEQHEQGKNTAHGKLRECGYGGLYAGERPARSGRH